MKLVEQKGIKQITYSHIFNLYLKNRCFYLFLLFLDF